MHGEKQPYLEENANYWDGAASRWAGLDLPGPDEVNALLHSLECPPGGLVLDAGCGAGRWSVAIAQAGYRVCGVDISPEMIASAEERAAKLGLASDAANFQVSELANLPFPDSSFDAVISRNVIDFVPSPGEALVELGRVLKEGGRLYVTVLGAYSPVKQRSWQRFLPGSNYPNISNHILPWELEVLLTELGWQILAQRPVFGATVSGDNNPYNEEISNRLSDRVLQQTIASSWEITALKPRAASGDPPSSWRRAEDDRNTDIQGG